jgi:two-component system phosphate regulon sensor histidine kinase PhoR
MRQIRGGLIPKSLAIRLALTYTALALLIMAGLGWTLVGAIRDFAVLQLRSDLLGETEIAADFVAPVLASFRTPDELAGVVERVATNLRARVTVVAADGTVIADSESDPGTMDNHAGRPEVQDAFRTGVGLSTRGSSTLDEPYLFAARAIDNGAFVVRLGMPVDVVDSLVWDIQQRVLLAAFLAAALMTGAGWFVARRIGEGLNALQQQAVAVARGRLDVTVEPAATRELGDLGRAFNTMTDQLRTTLAELERVRVRLEATLAHLSDGVIITDEQGHVVLANDAAMAMLAVRGAFEGEPFVAVGRDHELADLLADALAATDGLAERTIRHGRSGRVIQAAAQGIDAADGRIGLLVLRDVTELRRLEGVRRDFVANVSHELRTPLTSIRALVETLESGAIDDPEVSSEFLARIIAEVDRLALLVDELLDLARLESGRVQLALEEVDPRASIERVVRRMAPQIERAGLVVEYTIAAETPNIVADRARVDQVLLNLMHNAIKFTPTTGAVTILASQSGDDVEFRVTDTGVGVNPEDLPRLFERFYKADRARGSQGTGLGLAIAKHVVQEHGGRIWAEPNEPHGATFAFALPIAGPNTPVFADGDSSEST